MGAEGECLGLNVQVLFSFFVCLFVFLSLLPHDCHPLGLECSSVGYLLNNLYQHDRMKYLFTFATLSYKELGVVPIFIFHKEKLNLRKPMKKKYFLCYS